MEGNKCVGKILTLTNGMRVRCIGYTERCYIAIYEKGGRVCDVFSEEIVKVEKIKRHNKHKR